MGFGTGIAAAGGNVVAGGVATLAPLQPLSSLPQALDDTADNADVKEDDDEIEIVPQQYEEEAESQDELEVVEETEPAEAAMVEASEIPPDVRALTHIKTKCFTMPLATGKH